eukprot:gene3812-2698_t
MSVYKAVVSPQLHGIAPCCFRPKDIHTESNSKGIEEEKARVKENIAAAQNNNSYKTKTKEAQKRKESKSSTSFEDNIDQSFTTGGPSIFCLEKQMKADKKIRMRDAGAVPMQSISTHDRECIDELMDAILQRVDAAQARARINRHQCRYVQSRVRSLCQTLRRMPNPTPSLGIVTVFRAAVYVMELMGPTPEEEEEEEEEEGGLGNRDRSRNSSCSSETSVEVIFMSNDRGAEEEEEDVASLHGIRWTSGSPRPGGKHMADGEGGPLLESSNYGSGLSSQDCPLDEVDEAVGWKHLLLDGFTCESYFRGWDERCHGAWSLQSPSVSEEQRQNALAMDEKENAALLRRLYRPTLDMLQKRHRRYTWVQAQVPSTPPNPKAWGDHHPVPLPPDTPRRPLLGPGPAPPPIRAHSVHSASTSDRMPLVQLTVRSGSPNCTAPATMEEIVQFYRERGYASSWKIMYEDLDRVMIMPTDGSSPPYSPRRGMTPCSPVAADPDLRDDMIVWAGSADNRPGAVHKEVSGVNFALRQQFYWHGIPVTVQELDSHHLRGVFQSDTLSCFVQDAVVRSRWSFPGLVRYWGAFTEKLCTPEDERLAPRIAVQQWRASHPTPDAAASNPTQSGTQEGDELLFPVAFPPGTASAWSVPPAAPLAAASTGSRTGSQRLSTSVAKAGSPRLSVDTGPRICMGFIREALGDRDGVNPLKDFLPLHHYLYVQKRDFSPREITQILLQALGTILYMAHDKDDVPEDVWTSWLSISPSTLYVRLPLAPLGVSSHWQPLATSMRERQPESSMEVKYAPMCYVQGGAVSRWRPHPRAISPCCYALAQLLLGIYSRRVPYAKDWKFHRRLLSQDAISGMSGFAAAATGNEEEDEETEECASKVGVTPGIEVDPRLTPAGKELCYWALSLDKAVRPMSLQQFRDGLLRHYDAAHVGLRVIPNFFASYLFLFTCCTDAVRTSKRFLLFVFVVLVFIIIIKGVQKGAQAKTIKKSGWVTRAGKEKKKYLSHEGTTDNRKTKPQTTSQAAKYMWYVVIHFDFSSYSFFFFPISLSLSSLGMRWRMMIIHSQAFYAQRAITKEEPQVVSLERLASLPFALQVLLLSSKVSYSTATQTATLVLLLLFIYFVFVIDFSLEDNHPS